MFRLSIAALQFIELLLSSLVHLSYGFYIFSSAVAGDLSSALNALFFKSNIEPAIRDNSANSDDDLPPIVLVHGIFGFGKGVIIYLCSSYIHTYICTVCLHPTRNEEKYGTGTTPFKVLGRYSIGILHIFCFGTK